MTLAERIAKLQALVDGAGVRVHFKNVDEVTSLLSASDQYDYKHLSWCCALSTTRAALDRLKLQAIEEVNQRLTQ